MRHIDGIRSVELPIDFHVMINWNHVETSACIKTDQRTDAKGWRYAHNFQYAVWTSSSLMDSCVRRRTHQRLLVPTSEVEHARELLPRFYTHLSSIRSFNEHFLCSSLLGKVPLDHLVFQIVMECERRPAVDKAFSPAELLPTDPPHWSVTVASGSGGQAEAAPWLDPSTALSRSDLADMTTAHLIAGQGPYAGLAVLHDFMFSLYSLHDAASYRDSSGWQYGRRFFSDEDAAVSSVWTQFPDDPEPEPGVSERAGSLVRRRVWIRTLVPHSSKRLALATFKQRVLLSPRGACIKEGPILRSRPFGMGWTKGWATLSDYKLSIASDQGASSSVVFDLIGHEVSKVPELVCFEGFRSGFGLRKRDFGNTDNNLVVELSADTEEERRAWVSALSHQLALLHCDCFGAPFAPPLADEILVSSDMWKRRETVPAWSLRTLELRASGTLFYYDGSRLRGTFDIVDCEFVVHSPHEVGGVENTFLVNKCLCYVHM
jgi:hypothetical protein